MGLAITLVAALLPAWTACSALVGIEELEAAPITEPGPVGTCSLPSDCPLAGNACFLRLCVGGLCALTDAPAGTLVSSQVAGDCKQVQCDVNGDTMEAPANDPFDDGSDCTQDLCAGSAVQHNPVQQRMPCQGGVCDGAGTCVECIDNMECTGLNLCNANKCVPPTCIDTLKNALETAVDCGGPDCNPCGDNETCAVDDDCVSKVCSVDLTCAAPTCGDEVTNGNETDVDCGGAGECDRCPDTAHCMDASDCRSKVCQGSLCLAPTCIDGVLNGTEAALDCGPSCPPGSCDNGEPCTEASQCLSKVCSEVCQEPTCEDEVQNGTETGIDCGEACNMACPMARAQAALSPG
jgi:hypothetical protein